jgi:cell division protein FtsI/penicillin-binding protein 2
METKSSVPTWRILTVAAIISAGFLLLVAQLVRWQVVQRKDFLPEPGVPASQSGRTLIARGPERGAIVDINGEPLAFDSFHWEIWVEPWLVPEGDEATLAARLVQALGPSLQVAPEELQQRLLSHEKKIVMLTRNAPQPVGQLIDGWEDAPGVVAKPLPGRTYPQGPLASHMLGFVNTVPQAFYGVEEYYDNYLLDLRTPWFPSDPDVQAVYRRLPSNWQQVLPSAVGQDLVLTIDRRVQATTERILGEAIGLYKAESGSIVVMDPKTGAILAMVSLPAYDPNQYAATKTELLADPAITVPYEPGSVFKIVTMASGIDAGLVTPSSVLTDSLSIEVGGREIYNSVFRSYGEVTLREALVRSLNIPTAEVALMLDESRFYQYVRRFGFGQLTEIDLANESPGTVKVPGDPLWSQVDLATNAFGQGLAVTPVQMARATAVIANGGMLVKPHVVDSMVFRGRVIKPDIAPARRVIRPETAAQVTDMMVSVVEEGSPAAGVRGYRVAGKTGTAQVPIGGSYSPTETIHSFVGFVPADAPLFVAVVKLDVPKTHPWADSTAAPTFSRLATELLRIWRVPPEQVANRP